MPIHSLTFSTRHLPNMVRVLITGSADGLGLEAARQLVKRGHTVYLHARNEKRAADAKAACPGAAGVLTADLSNVAENRRLAEEANAIGQFDAVILNAGMLSGPFRKTSDTGIPSMVFVNVVAPYILTCLLRRPKRLVYISSQLHRQGDTSLEDIFWLKRGEARFRDFPAYCDSKLHVLLLANAVARRFKDTSVVSVHPGWDGVETYVMLAEGGYNQSLTGKYFEPKRKLGRPLPISEEINLQEKVVKACEEVTGLKLRA
ncbi:putative short chain dehydrogenase [Aspergillus novofumigatus IBT 16806]|uniref:Putative short chain dehydrogenase n=1 Tax=Aspergillus novofumigatus (strain IBT 16806) TaxID=1392255 RepID=A0A2I1BUH7_ASPN1|nr:putative short chain dehydrogenase [Aspergillus novofumigatus IBT 16806]PKX88941.1 putative short chain dehydrogenase [Aspergillus novofumigatus IBT 16806]